MRNTWLFIIPPIVLVAIVAIAWIHYRKHSHERDLKKVAVIAHTRTIKELPAYRQAVKRYKIMIVLAAVSFLVTIFSLTAVAARPVEVTIQNTKNQNRDIILCLDVSGSMDDYRNTLLAFFADIADKLRGQRVGFTIFDGRPANLIPLSDDYDEVIELTRDFMESPSGYIRIVRGDTLQLNASAIGDGVMGCVNSLDRFETNNRSQSIIIATDNNYGTSQTANTQSVDIGQVANYAKRYGITFYGIYMEGGAASNYQIEQYKNATVATGGSFYTVTQKTVSDESTTRSILQKVLAQEAAKAEGAPEVIKNDAPMTALIISSISLATFIILAWRLRI